MDNANTMYEPLIVELNDDKLMLSFDDARSRRLVKDYCRTVLTKQTGSADLEQTVPDAQLENIIENLLKGLGKDMKEGKVHIELNP